MRPLPRALVRARLWTSGLLSASVVAVGALGVHLAQDHSQAVAARTSSTSSSSSSSSDGGSSGLSGFSWPGLLGSSGSDQGQGNQSNGFAAVSPLSGSGRQAQSGSGGS